MPIKITREDTKDCKVAIFEPIQESEPTIYDLAYLHIEVRWIREFNLNELELLVFGFINSYRPSTGKIYFSNAQLGKMFNKSDITISRTICSLRDKKMIDVEIQNTMGGAIRYLRPSDEFLDKSRYSKMTRPLLKNDKTPTQKRLGNSNINNNINSNISKDKKTVPSTVWQPYIDKYNVYYFTRKDSSGYRLLSKYNPPRIGHSDIVQEHKWIYENEVGKTPDGYIINHKNHIKDDNRIENLEIMTQSEHITKHHKEGIVSSANSDGTYGNQEINICIMYLQEKLGASLDGSIKENRQYCYNLLRKMKKDYPNIEPVIQVKMLIDVAIQDKFHSQNATGFKYLFYNTQRIAQSFKGDYGIGEKNSDIQVI